MLQWASQEPRGRGSDVHGENASHIDGGGNFDPSMNYNPGGAGQVVVVRLFYQWPVYVSLVGFNLSNMSGGKRLLVATAAFRNEPYQ